jgi:CheY-like chemotaxis protein
MTVLYADDDPEDIEFFCDALREVDPEIHCISAKDGKEALQILQHDLIILPDYIFLDINMPVMDGKTCLTEIMKDKRLKHIPVIMYSTTTDAAEIKKYYTLGAYDFLIKPHQYAKLHEALMSIFVHTTKKSRIK